MDNRLVAEQATVFYIVKSDNEMLGFWNLEGIETDQEALEAFKRIISDNNNPEWPYRLHRYTTIHKDEVIAE